MDEFWTEVTESLRFPLIWSTEQDIYECAVIHGTTDFEKSWSCLKTTRNNLFYANKAYRPDPVPRLEAWLSWSRKFMDELMNGDYEIKAKEIKLKLDI